MFPEIITIFGSQNMVKKNLCPPLVRSNLTESENVKFYIFSILPYEIQKIVTAL